jgi:hypothetical protein
MKRILDFVENVATEGEFPENQFYLLVVDINMLLVRKVAVSEVTCEIR